VLQPRLTYSFADAFPFVTRVFEAFGPDRLLFGTGYPGGARTNYQRPSLDNDKEIDLLRKEIPYFTAEDRDKILGRNAATLGVQGVNLTGFHGG
jgi:predicted TIM-barrel fold metal-dependent hydrolase